MSDIAQPGRQSYVFLVSDEDQRIIATWRLRAIAFYASLLALMIACAAMSTTPRELQADLASDDFVTHYISNPPVP